MNFTHNNHLYYTIGSRKLGYRETPSERFKVYAGNIDWDIYRKSSYREELRKTADLVLKDLGKDLIVFFSGGTDSDIVIRNFLEIGHKPRVAVIDFEYNKEDVKDALTILKDLDIKPIYIKFDLKDYYYSGAAAEFGQEIQCYQIAYLNVFNQVKEMSCPSVMGGEMLMRKYTGKWAYTLREVEDCGAMRFSMKYNIPLVNEWFSYTPELMLYYIEDPEIQNLIRNKNHKLSTATSKNNILHKYFPKVKLRDKTTGYENLLAFNYEVYSNIRNSITYRLNDDIDGIYLSDLIKQWKS